MRCNCETIRTRSYEDAPRNLEGNFLGAICVPSVRLKWNASAVGIEWQVNRTRENNREASTDGIAAGDKSER